MNLLLYLNQVKYYIQINYKRYKFTLILPIQQAMFDDMFDTPQQILSGVKEGQVLSSWERLPRNCADIMPLPEKQRKKGYPIGLKNQGATCYLNSFFQILFLTPELRKIILDLPLCNDSIQNKTNFLEQGKHKFLLGFQRLFSEMSLRDVNSVGTDYLNKAFGWEGKQHVQQHDMTQAMKIIFETIQRALYNTQYEKSIRNLYKGITSRYKSCRNCTVSTQKQEDYYDLLLQVKNLNSVQQSLMNLLTAESMQGQNKIFCDVCQSKQDMWLGTRIKSLPDILAFTLNRFQFDYQKLDRVKLNDFFRFQLEYNFSHLVQQSQQNQEFQLYGVIIHRGSAHGGHYYCYIRDLMHQSNWNINYIQAQKEKQKLEKQKTPIQQLTQEQKKKRQQLQKQDKIHQLKATTDKSLQQNWYELNDNVVTAIDVKKITSKFQGSDCAYMLFYRRKGLNHQNIEMKVPEYFSKTIQLQNQTLKKQREVYLFQKSHIILKINGCDQKLSIHTKIKDFVQKYCPQGFSLVMQLKHNDLPYYPLQFNNIDRDYGEQDTIQKYDIYHQSIWKTYLIPDEEYQQIKQSIGKQKIPFQVNILFQGKSKKVVLYTDMTLTALRLKIQNDYQIPYETQIIQLVTPYKQIFVTDDLANDELLLTKIGFIHECQVILKTIQQTQEKVEDGQQKINQKAQTDLICFIIERDDVIGIKRLYFSKYQKLKELLQSIMKTQGIQSTQKRRLRNLDGNRLYYIDHYQKSLIDLNFNDEMIKLRIERGQIPIKGDVCVKVKLQSKFQNVQENTIIQKIFDPNTIVSKLKIQICQEAKLNPQLHRLYLTDWMGQPVRPLTKEQQTLFQTNFSREETICLRDIESPIGSQLLHFQIYTTETGSPDNISSDCVHFKIQMHKTVLQFKEKLLELQNFKEKNLKAKNLRVREVKKDYMFGTILRHNQKSMKDVSINSNKIVVQVMKQQQQLTQQDIVLILKKRNIETRIYEFGTQIIFHGGKNPKLEDLQKAIKVKLQLDDNYPLSVIKYFNYNFQWTELNIKFLQSAFKTKKQNNGKNQKKRVQKQVKQKGKKRQKPNEEKNIDSIQEKNIQPAIEKNCQEDIKIQNTQKQKQIQEKRQEKRQDNKDNNKNEQKQNKKQKKNNKQKTQLSVQKSEDYLNLRKPPTLLKDGDWIGWANKEQIFSFKDDLQTQQDLSLRVIKKQNKAVSRKNQGKGFKINVGF